MTGHTAQRQQVSKALGKVARKVKELGERQWDVTLCNGQLLRSTAQLNDGWLILRAALSGNGRGSITAGAPLWDLLHWNATLGGGVKYSVDSQAHPEIRAEVPLDDGVDIGSRIAEVCSGFTAASERFHRKKMGKRATFLQRIEGHQDDVTSNDLQGLCKEAGWPFVEKRAGGRLAVELEVLDGFFQAMVEQIAGGIHIAVELGVSAVSPVCREALGLLLLTANAVVRMVRAVVAEQDGQTIVRFEMAWASSPAVSEIAHALAALSVVCTLCGREVEVLADETIAKEYLAIRGRSSRSC